MRGLYDSLGSPFYIYIYGPLTRCKINVYIYIIRLFGLPFRLTSTRRQQSLGPIGRKLNAADLNMAKSQLRGAG